MSAAAGMLEIMKAFWLKEKNCFLCHKPPEVFVSHIFNDVKILFCKECTRLHLDTLIDCGYRLSTGQELIAAEMRQHEDMLRESERLAHEKQKLIDDTEYRMLR